MAELSRLSGKKSLTLESWTARLQLEVVFPTPPLPPTKTHLNKQSISLFIHHNQGRIQGGDDKSVVPPGNLPPANTQKTKQGLLEETLKFSDTDWLNIFAKFKCKTQKQKFLAKGWKLFRGGELLRMPPPPPRLKSCIRPNSQHSDLSRH